ncbi:unnamed protein product [Cyprideis torosa]|uniref:Poly [ADP-ribose] polymerase n=1 Tax=Cyprideis torosa TaxID=163714 RepID=A0A7R8WDI8_9CRUS|nr:unnamed protein product [Cyprideis torosa]CAG0894677.1 unnamed protein product [Cyprideis torosa]
MPRGRKRERAPSPGLAAISQALKKSRKAVDKKSGGKREKSKGITSSVASNNCVDALCPLFGTSASVFEDSSGPWTCMLNQTNLAFNNNKYYLIQVLKEEGDKYSVWFRWGRVGFKGQTKLESCGKGAAALTKAKTLFEKKFHDKTLNHWEEKENFVKHDRKYELLKMNFGVSSTDDEVDAKTKNDGDDGRRDEKKEVKSKLDERVQELIQKICDINTMRQSMVEMKYDANKAPLGKLTEEQIKAGYLALAEIVKCLEVGKSRSCLVQANNEYYTRIPHFFGMKTPPLIQSSQDVRKELEMLESLAEIEVIVTMLKTLDELEDLHPIDQKYLSLKCSMEPVDPSSDMCQKIVRYISSTHAKTHSLYAMKPLNMFRVEREGEEQRFKDCGNRMLLWHGSRISNWAGILYQGLRVAPEEAPSTGFMFGKGIYFADVSSKSANYCYASRKNNKGLLVLCEVALGKPKVLAHADYEADRLPKTYHSVHGVGKFQSLAENRETLEDGSVIPYGPIDYEFYKTKLGQLKNEPLDLNYNEYVVYNENQIRLRYLVEIEFQFK